MPFKIKQSNYFFATEFNAAALIRADLKKFLPVGKNKIMKIRYLKIICSVPISNNKPSTIPAPT